MIAPACVSGVTMCAMIDSETRDKVGGCDSLIVAAGGWQPAGGGLGSEQGSDHHTGYRPDIKHHSGSEAAPERGRGVARSSASAAATMWIRALRALEKAGHHAPAPTTPDCHTHAPAMLRAPRAANERTSDRARPRPTSPAATMIISVPSVGGGSSLPRPREAEWGGTTALPPYLCGPGHQPTICIPQVPDQCLS